jgi:hypothetical protein
MEKRVLDESKYSVLVNHVNCRKIEGNEPTNKNCHLLSIAGERFFIPRQKKRLVKDFLKKF